MTIYLVAFCRQIPIDDTIQFLERLCLNHHFLVDNRSESWKVLKILECLTEKKIPLHLKEKVRPLILKLVSSNTPGAEDLLRRVDNET